MAVRHYHYSDRDVSDGCVAYLYTRRLSGTSFVRARSQPSPVGGQFALPRVLEGMLSSHSAQQLGVTSTTTLHVNVEFILFIDGPGQHSFLTLCGLRYDRPSLVLFRRVALVARRPPGRSCPRRPPSDCRRTSAGVGDVGAHRPPPFSRRPSLRTVLVLFRWSATPPTDDDPLLSRRSVGAPFAISLLSIVGGRRPLLSIVGGRGTMDQQ